MCFSAKADLVAGLVVGAFGVDAWFHVRSPSEQALAAIPVVLAGHQLIESLVWLGLQGRIPKEVLPPAEFAYLTIAFGVVPVLVPVAVGILEPPGQRQKAAWLTATGAVVAAALMEAVVRGPITASIRGHDIGYHVNLKHGGALVGLYVAATCGSLLLSSQRHVRWFGVINLVAAGLLASLERFGFISLWCVWAAVGSIAIALHLRFAPRPAAPSPDGSAKRKSLSTLTALHVNCSKTVPRSISAARDAWFAARGAKLPRFRLSP